MKSREIALCGMLNALAVVLMNLGSLVPLATFCTPLLAMLVLLPVLVLALTKAGIKPVKTN